MFRCKVPTRGAWPSPKQGPGCGRVQSQEALILGGPSLKVLPGIKIKMLY
jgi:hypothetical protein